MFLAQFKHKIVCIETWRNQSYFCESTTLNHRKESKSLHIWINRSSCPEVFCKKGVLKTFAKFTGKHLCQSLLFNIKETLAQMFSCEFCEILKNTFFIEHLRWLLLNKMSRGNMKEWETPFTREIEKVTT